MIRFVLIGCACGLLVGCSESGDSSEQSTPTSGTANSSTSTTPAGTGGSVANRLAMPAPDAHVTSSNHDVLAFDHAPFALNQKQQGGGRWVLGLGGPTDEMDDQFRTPWRIEFSLPIEGDGTFEIEKPLLVDQPPRTGIDEGVYLFLRGVTESFTFGPPQYWATSGTITISNYKRVENDDSMSDDYFFDVTFDVEVQPVDSSGAEPTLSESTTTLTGSFKVEMDW